MGANIGHQGSNPTKDRKEHFHPICANHSGLNYLIAMLAGDIAGIQVD